MRPGIVDDFLIFDKFIAVTATAKNGTARRSLSLSPQHEGTTLNPYSSIPMVKKKI